MSSKVLAKISKSVFISSPVDGIMLTEPNLGAVLAVKVMLLAMGRPSLNAASSVIVYVYPSTILFFSITK